MPPVPKIGEVPTTSGESTSTIFSSKKVAESSGDSKLSSNIFASALKQSNVDNKSNIFSAKPSAPGNVIQEMTWRFMPCPSAQTKHFLSWTKSYLS